MACPYDCPPDEVVKRNLWDQPSQLQVMVLILINEAFIQPTNMQWFLRFSLVDDQRLAIDLYEIRIVIFIRYLSSNDRSNNTLHVITPLGG